MNTKRMERSRRFPLALLLLALGCGDGGGPSPVDPDLPGPGPEPGTTEMTDEERTEAFRAIDERVVALQRQDLSRDAFNAALAEWLKGRPEFESAGVAELSSVWAVFRDGRVVVVANNRDPVPPSDSVLSPAASLAPGGPSAALAPTALAASAAPSELPMPKQVRLLHSLGPGFAGQAPIDDLARWFRDAGYDVVAGAEGDARVETLRHVSGDAFFYLNTHGARADLSPSESYYVVGTSSLASAVKDSFPDFKDDLVNRRLVYLKAPNGEVTPDGEQVWDWRYAITHKFVDAYMSFGTNSIVFLNVCGSAYPSPTVQAFMSSVKQKGAAVYVGWTNTVNADPAYRGVRYFVDRLLGANEYLPEDPKQRPFGWSEVLEDMGRKSLDLDPISGARLVASAGVQSEPMVGLLAPSIRNLIVDEFEEKLIISGAFGSHESSEGRVLMKEGGGETELDIVSWEPTEIIARLPRSGAGSSGDVVVEVRKHRSNERRLMAWRGKIVYTLQDVGSLRHRVEMELDLRFDPETFRTKPGEPPPPLPKPFVSTGNPRSRASYAASGEYRFTSGDCTVTHSYSGAGTLQWPQAPDPTGYAFLATIDAEGRSMDLTLVVFTPYRHVRVTQCDDDPATATFEKEMSIPGELRPTGTVRLRLDDQLNILPGGREVLVPSSVSGGSATATLEWQKIVATPAYDPEMAR